MRRIREYEERRGYVGVKAEHVFALGPVAAQGQPIPLVVEFRITEGPRTLIRTVSFAGREALNAERLNAVIKIHLVSRATIRSSVPIAKRSCSNTWMRLRRSECGGVHPHRRWH